MHEADFYASIKDKAVKCNLCPHTCYIQEGSKGVCAVRKNEDGKLHTLVYGKTLAANVDPIEKKPLYHFKPGSRIYSFATAGCNFKCKFCQNWRESQVSKGPQGEIIGIEKSPSQIVQEAIGLNCNSIAATYVEPTIFYEYAFDTFKIAKNKGLFTVFVSNGYINPEPIDKITPYLDAINIDLKSFSDEFYKKTCGGRLQPVLDSIKYYHKKGIWVEITTLVIPGANDSEEELTKIAKFIADLDKNIPWHISRFHPDFNMLDKNPTPVSTLEKVYNIGKKAGLNYVYIGNVLGTQHENTYCHKCGQILIQRFGYKINISGLKDNKCKYCNAKISGFF